MNLLDKRFIKQKEDVQVKDEYEKVTVTETIYAYVNQINGRELRCNDLNHFRERMKFYEDYDLTAEEELLIKLFDKPLIRKNDTLKIWTYEEKAERKRMVRKPNRKPQKSVTAGLKIEKLLD
jgi:hypothetical protein